MKLKSPLKRYIVPALLLPLVCAAILLGCLISFGRQKKVAEAGVNYNLINALHITYDVRADRTWDVTMDLTARYIYGNEIIYDIPVSEGDRVRNITATEIYRGREYDLIYKVYSPARKYISVEIADDTLRTEYERTYRIRYTYETSELFEGEDANTILIDTPSAPGGGIDSFTVTVNAPDGMRGAELCLNTAGGAKPADAYDGGNTFTHQFELLSDESVTIKLTFDDGVLTHKKDKVPYFVIIGACALFALLAALKLLAFNYDGLTPVINTQPPEDMDPLMMGKLIDNKVDQSDLTSLLYYWANKGYICINLENEKDPLVIRIFKELPQGAPAYQVKLYNALFKDGDEVHTKNVGGSFARASESVKRSVDSACAGLYSGASFFVATLFFILGTLAMALTPVILCATRISAKFASLISLAVIPLGIIIFVLSLSVKYKSLKLKKSTLALAYLGIAALAAAFSALYVLIVPSYAIEVVPKILLCVAGFSTCILAGLLISRKPDYVKKLNGIVGFKQFILTAEKDKLEMMLEQNPVFYYNILPYAIVLGVSDLWEDKFKSLTVQKPDWVSGAKFSEACFNFIVFTSIMRSINMSICAVKLIRAAHTGIVIASAMGGRIGGGGFHGGGHGGGGFRGK